MHSYPARAFALALLLGVTTAAAAQEFWVKKDPSEWNQREVRRLLENSPWAKRHVSRQNIMQPIGRASAQERTERGDESSPEVFYQVVFRSARPVRQAVVRQAELNRKPEQMPEQERAQFVRSLEDYLEADYSQIIAVEVSYGSNVIAWDRELAEFWQNQYPPGAVPADAFLILAGGERISVQRFSVTTGGGRSFQFIFPRYREDGTPLVKPQDRSLSVEFRHPGAGDRRPTRVLVSFDPRRMMVDKDLVY